MKSREPLIHILCWLVGFALCYLGETIRFGALEYGSGAMFLIMAYGTLFHVGVFYLAAFRHVPLWRERRMRRLMLESVALMVLSIATKTVLLWVVIRTFRADMDPSRELATVLIVAQAVIALVFQVFGFTYRLSRDAHRDERLRRQLEHERISTELSYLKTQVNPHFLFNTLNNLFGLANREGAEQTGESILKLAELMRYQLHDAEAETVPLQLEIANLNNFIDLHRLRISPKHDVHIELRQEGEMSRVQVPPMLFLPLVENAFKYGVSYKAPSEILMSLSVEVSQLHFTVENTVHHKDHQQEHTSGGIGLENLKRRLSLLYHGKDLYHFEQHNQRYLARLTLPLDTPRTSFLQPKIAAVPS